MLNLKDFYFKQLCSILPSDRYITILEIDDVIVVNFDCLFDREYLIRGTDQLIYQLHKKGHGKRFLFISEDGAILQMSGAIPIIENIVNCFNLSSDTCAVFSREDINIPNVHTFKQESIPYWCMAIYPTVKNIPLSTGPFTKKFAVWFNRGTFYRLKTVKHLQTYYANDCYISYQEKGMLVDRKLTEYFEDELVWAALNTPIVYDHLWPDRRYTHEMIVGISRKPYNDYFIEIVVDTDTITTNWITEKSVKNLYIGKPFVLMSGAGALAKIHSFGFKTFSPWIDESYDNITNNYDRYLAITNEIDRIAKLSINELTELATNMQVIFEHNRKQFLNYLNE